MRKVIISLISVLTCASLARGQGQLAFNNTSGTLISTNAVHGGPAVGPTESYPGGGAHQFVYALFAAPSTITSVSGVMDANWTFTGAYASNSSVGRLIGGGPVLPAPYAVGSTFSFLVRGWSSSIAGLDWPTVQGFIYNFEVDPNASGSQGQLFGTSSIATTAIGGDTLPVATIFGTLPGFTIPGFLLDQVPTPEPSIFALIGLGGVTLLTFRRKGRLRSLRNTPAA